jgi:hypothetical protein
MLSSQWNSVAVIIILRYASFVTKGSMNVSEKRKALSAISTPGVFSSVCSVNPNSILAKIQQLSWWTRSHKALARPGIIVVKATSLILVFTPS